MENITKHLIFLLVLCAHQTLAQPPPKQAAAAPALAEARVQDWARIAPGANQALSAAEKSMGRNIIRKLDSILVDPNDRRPGRRRCLNEVDLVLILDSSGSIGASEFSRGKRASKTLVDYVHYRCPISRYGSQIGLIEFSTPQDTHREFSLGTYTSHYPNLRAIDRVDYDYGSSTATANALALARTEFNQNSRIGNAKVAWILTDGNSNTGGNPRIAARDLKRNGVTVCAVAIGNRINMAEINDIASYDCVYRASSFTRYDKILEFAAAEARGSAQESPALDPGFFNGIRFK